MIEQIPARISVVSLDRARRIGTPIGVYDIHHLTPELFGGYDGDDIVGYVALPEKTLFDLVSRRLEEVLATARAVSRSALRR